MRNVKILFDDGLKPCGHSIFVECCCRWKQKKEYAE